MTPRHGCVPTVVSSVAVRFSFEKIVTVRDREIFQPATEQGDGYEL
jgi:hypothetical protein